ncbi:MAG: prohibitin family protein [Bacteroidales bacterium]|nr:prohibitin family protein [Bacteroidales bacterium]
MKKSTTFWILLVVIALIAGILSSATFITLQPGERGVIFRKFTTGLDKEHIYQPGFKIIAPWNDMYLYNVKEQQEEEELDVLDKNGLNIAMDVSVRFHPLYDKIGHLHENFGENYVRQLVVPEVRSTVRRVAGRYTAEEIYSTKRKEVETAIKEETRKVLQDNYVNMRALLIRSIRLPEQIKNAIEKKLKEEQESLAYEYRLERERSEAERKEIQAEGEARANQIISESLSPELLKMRGIEATLKLSESQNSKVVVIGSGDSGLPVILGNQ